MSAAVIMQTCPSEETLAAFIDGRLDERTRQQVIEHLASCGECRDVVVTANEYSSSVEASRGGGEVVPGNFRKRVLPALIAAAAAIAIVVGVPSIREKLRGDPMVELVEQGNHLRKRPTAGRLSGMFVYKKYERMRGGPGETARVEITPEETQVELATWNAIQRAQDQPTVANLHAAGVGRLFLGRTELDAAVSNLENAAAKATPPSAAILNDLATAYIARGDKGDYERARAAAIRAWNLERLPAAAWNIATALHEEGRDAQAIAAYQRYLKIDPNSDWAAEAKYKIETLQTLQKPKLP